MADLDRNLLADFDEDAGRLYEKCLQCGYERELMKVSLKKREPIEQEKTS